MKKYRKHYRRPKTTQEKRADNDETHEFIRGKRHANCLPTVRDDLYIKPSKSWKDRRKQKYNTDKLRKYTIQIGFTSILFDRSSWDRFRSVEKTIESLGYRITKSDWHNNTITFYGKYIDFKKDYIKYIYSWV